MAALGHILDCKEANCADVQIICGVPFYTMAIGSDPTGVAFWNGDGLRPQICIPDGVAVDEKNPVILADLVDALGQRAVVRFPLVDCTRCCEDFVFAGNATTNPDTTYTATITPACEDTQYLTITASSNSGCTFNPTVDAGGAGISLVLDSSACGTITLTLTYDHGDCDAACGS